MENYRIYVLNLTVTKRKPKRIQSRMRFQPTTMRYWFVLGPVLPIELSSQLGDILWNMNNYMKVTIIIIDELHRYRRVWFKSRSRHMFFAWFFFFSLLTLRTQLRRSFIKSIFHPLFTGRILHIFTSYSRCKINQHNIRKPVVCCKSQDGWRS